MESFKNIVLATDFGPDAMHAADVLARFVDKSAAKVTLLHVWDIPLPAYAENVVVPFEEMRGAARTALEGEAARLAPKLPKLETMLLAGLPWSTIVDSIAEHGFDLVVVGTHGRRGLKRAVLGSVAEKVVRGSPVPVLTIRRPPEGTG